MADGKDCVQFLNQILKISCLLYFRFPHGEIYSENRCGGGSQLPPGDAGNTPGDGGTMYRKNLGPCITLWSQASLLPRTFYWLRLLYEKKKKIKLLSCFSHCYLVMICLLKSLPINVWVSISPILAHTRYYQSSKSYQADALPPNLRLYNLLHVLLLGAGWRTLI